MDFLPIGHARTDPIMTQTCLSDHVHTFYGPQAVRPETGYETLINTPTDLNTGNVEENKSLYWHPTVYSYDQNSNTYTRDIMAQTSAYYIWENEANVKAFPNGFKMIAGLNPDDPTNFPNAMAECVGRSTCQRDDCRTENSFFPADACEELEVSMSFPTCWDGRLDSDDHVSHVHYTEDGELDGLCPDTHPLRLPKIEFFFRIVPYDGGWHTFSDGSGVFHADYMSGWDEAFLQNVLDECQTDSFAAMPDSFCENFLTFRDAPKCTNENCDFGDPALLEKLKEFQPEPLDILNTVTDEETRVIVGDLPRGTCTGELIPVDDTSSPVSNPTNLPVTSPTISPTDPPVIPPTPSPVASPTNHPTHSPVLSPTPAPIASPTTDVDECEDFCWEIFYTCETQSDQTCETYFEECEDDCIEAEEGGDIDEDELDLCIEEWCFEDKEFCHQKGDRQCFRQRRRCIRHCNA